LGLLSLMPADVLIVTPTEPALTAAGLVAVIEVLLFTVKLVAGVVPKLTAVAPVNPVPVILTVVPPVVGPPGGLTPLTVGAATAAW